MNSPFKKTRFIFLLIIILPTLIFSIYEVGSFRQNEKVIETIYNNQLDAILYSVNQYSNDVISGWRSKLNVICNTQETKPGDELTSFEMELQGVHSIFQYDLDFNPISGGNSDKNKLKLQTEIAKLLKDSSKTINKLERYLRSGYPKVEPFNLQDENHQLLVFLIKTKNKTIVNALVLNPLEFISNVLDPRIQQIAQDKFYIGAYFKNKENVVYNSDKHLLKAEFTYSKPFWYFTNYYIGIELKDQTINELVKSRSINNIYLILIIDLVLLFGALLINRNIKRQLELAQLKSDFISNVSHEIRTPLALVSMYIETLELDRVRTEEKKKEYYSIIFNETQRLSNMVNKILNFSQIENDKRKYSYSKTNVNTVINEVLNTFKFHLAEKKFDLELALEDNIPEILADSEALADAIINLLDNAIKYSANQKFIGIKTGKQKDKVFIEIIDKGIGISESDQKKIFEKFYRVTEKNLAHKAKGSGLGLSIVKHVMDKHNAKIIIKSKIGSGTTFRLVFPAE